MVASVLNVQERGGRVHGWIGDNHHDIRVGRKGVNKGTKPGIAHFHSLELALGFSDRQFKLFDDIGYLFKPVIVKEFGSFHVAGLIAMEAIRVCNSESGPCRVIRVGRDYARYTTVCRSTSYQR